MKTFTLQQSGEFLTFFKEHGWLHIKNVFPIKEIAELREKAYATKARGYRGDLLANQETAYLISDDRILNIVKIILQVEKPVYFGDSSGINIGSKIPGGFHKDNPDKFDGNNPDWKTDYTVIRMGIYCQSHVNYSASLALRDKSHNSPSSEKGTPFFVNNEAGDLIIWSLRTSHSGNSFRFKFAPNFFLHPRFYNKLPKFLYKNQEKERVAYFLTYAKDRDDHLKRYLTYLLKRRYMVSSWLNSKIPALTVSTLKEKNNIKVIDMYNVVKDSDLNSIPEQHTEMQANIETFNPQFLY